MVKVDSADGILGSVNNVTSVLHSSFDDKSGRIASLGGTCVIGASVTTLGSDERDSAVLHSISSSLTIPLANQRRVAGAKK